MLKGMSLYEPVPLSRKEFVTNVGVSLAVLSLFQFSFMRKAFSAIARPEIAKWLNQTNALATAVKDRAITVMQWQHSMEDLLGRIDLPAFLKLIHLETLAQNAALPEKGESFEKFSFGPASGMPEHFKFYRNLAGFRKGRAIPPHGHNNLVSSFLVLKGELHGRHFDRLSTEGNHFLVKPTLDRVFKAGDFSTVSDDRDNVHWFQALTDECFIFDFGVDHIQPHWTPKGWSPADFAKWQANAKTGAAAKASRVYLDLNQKERTEQDRYKVAILSHEDAYRLYG